MKLLLISNSTNAGEAYLDYPKHDINNFLGKVKKIMFVPYAAVTFGYDEYQAKVQERLGEFDIEVDSIHLHENKVEAIKNAEAIVVGGGNTWHLLKTLQDLDLVSTIKEQVEVKEIPYIGWSAGSNMACPTIKTTNDMPISEPKSFSALGLIPFQLNPHYLDANPEGHAGETREQRIEEFLVANKEIYVAGLREGCILKVLDKDIELIGQKTLRVFKHDQEPMEYVASEKFDFLFC